MSADLEIVQMEVGLLQNFCEILGCPETGEAALVDPAFEVDRLLAVVRERNWRVTTILLTHTHEDHIAGLDEAVAAPEAKAAVVRCHPYELATAKTLAPHVVTAEDGEMISIGRGAVQAIYTPGHTPGCICWYVPAPGALITGDVLFVGSCGGVHYPDSDPAAMVDSLQNRLGALPEETKLYPGHDYGKTPTSTLFWERMHNPALTNDTVESFSRYKRVR